MSSKPYRRKMWGGFANGRLCIDDIDDGFGGLGNGLRKSPAIFPSRRVARERFQDVRRVEICEVKP